jgi:hypothetical protein
MEPALLKRQVDGNGYTLEVPLDLPAAANLLIFAILPKTLPDLATQATPVYVAVASR